MRESKTQYVRRLIISGNIERAISTVAKFRMGFTRDEQRLFQISKDVINGRGHFYTQIGIDIDNVYRQAKEVVLARYSQ